MATSSLVCSVLVSVYRSGDNDVENSVNWEEHEDGAIAMATGATVMTGVK